MKKPRKEKDFIRKPVYPGGSKAMKAFLIKQLVYPKEAKEKEVEGKVLLRYWINHEGRVVQVQVISGIGFGCDQEAERLVRLLRFQVDAHHKARVRFEKTIHIHFRLPKSEKSVATSYQYQYATSDTEAGIPKKPVTYSYQVTW